MPLPELETEDWWKPLQLQRLRQGLQLPLWLVLSTGWEQQMVLAHKAEQLRSHPGPARGRGRMSHLEPAASGPATPAERLAVEVCTCCIPALIQAQSGALAVPISLTAEQTAPRLPLSTPMPTQPRQAVPR